MGGLVLDDELRLEISPKLRLDALIARGSFGKVFRGRQLAVARDVAIKVLHAELALDTEPGRLFRDEIRAIGTIDHRNVVRIFDADESFDGRLYFVMELLEGPTLQDLCEKGPIAIERARALLAQLLDGLVAVHAAGRIHADIKPSNAVLVGTGANERVVLIDFGLSRVNAVGRPADAVGGTRPFMAPEQLSEWKVDAKSDVFSAALVFMKLATGWQRTGDELVPPLDGIEDALLRSVLAEALAIDPSQRPTARELAHALRGHATGELVDAPFRELAPLTESDRSRLHGRDDDLRRLVRRIDARSSVVLTAPSGVGKTSLLRAGLTDYLAARGTTYVYVACEPHTNGVLAEALSPGASSLAEAVATTSGRTIVILDQVEMMLGSDGDGPSVLEKLLDTDDSDLRVVLGVREDVLARLLDASPALAEGVPQVRLAPLSRAGASAAIVEPLREFDVEIASELLDRLLDDLERAGRQLALSNISSSPIYPPHLQLAGAALYESMAVGEKRLELAHYERLGGFNAIVVGHLDRTLDELSDADREIARALFLALVTGAQVRAVRSDQDLVDAVGPRHGEIAVARVLERLASRRLIARTHGADGVASWSLIHDTLVARIEAWVTVFDLDRRRMAELVRFHLRQSTPEQPALLSSRQLRELERFPGFIEELEVEWTRRSTVWGPRSLVLRSRQTLRYRRGLAIGAAVLVLAMTVFLVARWLHERHLRQYEGHLRDLNIGRIDLVLEPFDLRFDEKTGVTRVPVDVSALSELDWNLYEPDDPDRESPGLPIDSDHVRRGARAPGLETKIEIRGGDAFLVISGRGRAGDHCGRSVIPLRHLPGIDHFATARTLKVYVPTCQASRFDTIEIPAGPFIYSGVGIPPTKWAANQLHAVETVTLPHFAIDRTEVTNAAFAIFAELVDIHEIAAQEYADAFEKQRGPNYPRAALDWFDARAYCRFLGKDLPTTKQWQKALRGGEFVGGVKNPVPDRNLPWGLVFDGRAHVAENDANAGRAFGRVNDERHPVPVASTPTDRSPYGVFDLAGNMQEWTLDPEWDAESKPLLRQLRITRGGNWFDTTPESLVDYMAIENPRLPTSRYMFLGARCVLNPW